MKKSVITAFLSVGLIASELFAVDYVITANNKSVDGKDKFNGFDVSNYTSSPAIPVGGITAQDNVTLEGFYDIVAQNKTVSVNKFTYISSGVWGNGLSFSTADRTMTIQAKEAEFKVQYNNQSSYNPDNTDIRNAEFININRSNIIFKIGSANISTVRINQSAGDNVSGNCFLTIDAYDAETPSVVNINSLYANYATTLASYNAFTVKTGATANVASFYGSSTGSATAGNWTKINISGGTFNLGSFSYRLAGDDLYINHSSGTLGAKGNLNFTKNGKAGTLSYVIGENAVFNTKADTNAYTISLGSDVLMLKDSEAAKAGITVKGGGTLALDCAVSAIDGSISVTEKSALNLGSSWASNAQTIFVTEKSSINTSGEIALSAASNITMSIAGLNDFAKITGASISSDDGSFGSLIFNLQDGAFGDGNKLTLSLGDMIAAGTVDWGKFDISSNYEFVVNGGNITFTVPEPATVAAIFGALALALAVYRRRK